LGGGNVRLLELAAAFGVFDDGRTLPTQAILSIEEVGGNVPGTNSNVFGTALPSQSVQGAQILSPQAAWLVTDILADDVARQPAFGSNSVLKLPFAAAVKTGTTTDWRDNWTVGYSTQRIVGVWVGNADNSPMVDVSGVDGAGPIWHDLMLLAHPAPPADFIQPDKLVEMQICAASGLLPSRDCPRLRQERFIAGTQPQTADNQFQRLSIDLATGLPADEGTPENRRAERVYWRLPPAYHDWMITQGIAIAPAAEMAANAQDESVASQVNLPLRLTSPASYTDYQLHPGVEQQSQRLEAAGYTTDGRPWHSLRLVVDGQVLAEQSNAARLSAWWPMTPGAHAVWLEGEPTAGAETVRSPVAQVDVDLFTTGSVTMQTVD
jgi:membrane carboxypeptidase/penicillin-binding protein PbpC